MLTQGTILQSRYQIIQRIGGGGMGDVYLAYDLRLGNQVVVKENRGGDPQLFYTEATLLATLRHPNLPRVIDHFVEAATGAQYLVMDYIAGQNLEQIVQARGPLREQDALAWLNQILDAVKYLHANRISANSAGRESEERKRAEPNARPCRHPSRICVQPSSHSPRPARKTSGRLIDQVNHRTIQIINLKSKI